jgi:hypothetical protein
MCTRVYNRDTTEEAESPMELIKMLGVEPILDGSYKDISLDACLCQIDVEATAKKAGYSHEKQDGDPMDIHVWKETP